MRDNKNTNSNVDTAIKAVVDRWSHAKKAGTNLGSHLSKWFSHGRLGGWIPYRSTDFEELKLINRHYRTYIIKEQQGHESDELQTNTVLDIDWHKKVPRATEHEICRCFNYDREQNRGALADSFYILFQLIEAFVNARFAHYEARGYNHVNGAIILFCAEMADWVNKRANRPVDEPFLEEVKARVKYLSRLEISEALQKEAITDYAIDILIYNLRLVLENIIIPEIRAHLSIQTSREHFAELGRQAEKALNEIASALFYWLVADGSLGNLFSLKLIRTDIVNEQLQRIMNTPFGELFKMLAKAHYESDIQSDQLIQPFLNGYGIVPQNFFDQIVASKQEADQFKKSGLHSFFQSQEWLEKLIQALGLLCELSFFIHAFQQAYRLAGDGGDVVIYITLCRETEMILRSYFSIEREILQAIGAISGACDDQYVRLMQARNKHPWRGHHHLAHQYYQQAKESLMECSKQIQKMMCYMSQALSSDYKREVKDRMIQFRQVAEHINLRTEERKRLINASQNELSNARSIPVEEIKNSSTQTRSGSIVRQSLFGHAGITTKHGSEIDAEEELISRKEEESVINKKDFTEAIRILEENKEYDQARELYENLYKEYPNDRTLKFNYAKCLVRLDEDTESRGLGVKLFREILQQDNNNLLALYWVAVGEVSLGELSSAKFHLMELLNKDPENQEVHALFEKVLARLAEKGNVRPINLNFGS